MFSVNPDKGRPPPVFSPVLLAGLLLSPVPVRALQPFADRLMILVAKSRPKLFERLAVFAGRTIGVDVTDLPFVLLLSLDQGRPGLKIARDFSQEKPSALLRGPLGLLLDLAEGRIDGDSAFFGRQLSLSGDTEVVLALRNALDDSEISLSEAISSALGPLGRPLRRLGGLAGRPWRRLGQDMELLRQAMLAPLSERMDAQGAALADMEAERTAGQGGKREGGW